MSATVNANTNLVVTFRETYRLWIAALYSNFNERTRIVHSWCGTLCFDLYTHHGIAAFIVLTHHGITQVTVRRILNPRTLTIFSYKIYCRRLQPRQCATDFLSHALTTTSHPFISASFLHPVSLGSDIPPLWLSFVLALFWIQVFSTNLAYLRSSFDYVVLHSYIKAFLSYELREILSKVTSR